MPDKKEKPAKAEKTDQKKSKPAGNSIPQSSVQDIRQNAGNNDNTNGMIPPEKNSYR